MSAPGAARIERLQAPVSDADIRDLARLLIDAVESGAAVSFLSPLAPERAEAWWRGVFASPDPRSVVLVARDGDGIVGSVQLHPAWAPNQPHRADIAKLLVHRRARRAGLGTRLMERIEGAARDAGFTLLTLDAKRGGAAEQLYRRAGWIVVGTIPRYAVDPDGGCLHDTVVFCKELRPDLPMRAIATARLSLEPQVTAHAEEMFRVLGDPAIYEYENEPPPSVEWLRERFRRLESRVSPDGREQWLNWVLRLPSSGLIGYVQATVGDDGRAAIAYELASAYWGRGFGSEAVEGMIGELTGRYRVRALHAVLKAANHRSRRLLERLGFSPAPPDVLRAHRIEPDELLMIRLPGSGETGFTREPGT